MIKRLYMLHAPIALFAVPVSFPFLVLLALICIVSLEVKCPFDKAQALPYQLWALEALVLLLASYLMDKVDMAAEWPIWAPRLGLAFLTGSGTLLLPFFQS